jgi:pimeloyl-ACP methyl ester carboxylesterase
MPSVASNGIRIEYEDLGPKDGDPILLIMGLGQQLTAWPLGFCQMLTDAGFRVIRFDNRDTGFSTRFDEAGPQDITHLMMHAAEGKQVMVPYLLEDMADDAAGLIDALELGPSHIVGVSMGGMITQELAYRHPDKVRTMTSIMSTSGNPELPPAKPEAMAVLVSAPEDPSSRDSILDNLVEGRKIIGSPGFMDPDWVIRANAAIGVDRADYPVGVNRHLAAVIGSGSRVEKLKQINRPAHVIHGTDDPLVVVEGGKDTAEHIAGAKLTLIDGMGHDLATGLQPILADHIISFLREAS